MLDKPDLPDAAVLAGLQLAYDLPFSQVEFLPIGADSNTAVYRASLLNGGSYFARLRSGAFDELNVTLLKTLSEQGVSPVIAPLATRSGRLWASLDDYTLMLFPYIQGLNLYAADLPDHQWPEFGAALRRLHDLKLDKNMAMRIQRETYTPEFRQSLLDCLNRAHRELLPDPLASQCAALLTQRQAEIRLLVERTTGLAQRLLARSSELVLCHADLHAGNLLVEPGGAFYIIDWDDVLLAPRERDLMYIGGGLLGGWRSPAEEIELFYQGYGLVRIDPLALTYYRYERIIQDLAIYSQELLAMQGSREEREQSFRYLASNFDPGGVLEIARQADRA